MRGARTGLMLMGITKTSKSGGLGEGGNEVGRLHLHQVEKSISACREGSSSIGRWERQRTWVSWVRERMKQIV